MTILNYLVLLSEGKWTTVIRGVIFTLSSISGNNNKADELAEEGRRKGKDKDAYILHAYLDGKTTAGTINEWAAK